jgi:hypothetical protein
MHNIFTHKQTPEFNHFHADTYENELWNDYFDCLVDSANLKHNQSAKRICRYLVPDEDWAD